MKNSEFLFDFGAFEIFEQLNKNYGHMLVSDFMDFDLITIDIETIEKVREEIEGKFLFSCQSIDAYPDPLKLEQLFSNYQILTNNESVIHRLSRCDLIDYYKVWSLPDHTGLGPVVLKHVFMKGENFDISPTAVKYHFLMLKQEFQNENKKIDI